MSGSGGASSPSYPDYIEDVHRTMLAGGNTRETKLKYRDLGSSEYLLKIYQDALSKTKSATPYRAKSVYDPYTTENYEPAMLSKLEDLFPYEDKNTKFDSDELSTMLTDTKLVDSIRDTFDFTELHSTLKNVIQEAADTAGTHTDSRIRENKDLVKTLYTQLNPVVEKEVSNILASSVSSINTLVSNSLQEGIGTEVSGELNSMINQALNNASRRVDAAFVKARWGVDRFQNEIDDFVAAYEARTISDFQKSSGRLSTSMGNAGASTSSALARGLVELEEKRLRDVEEYREKIEFELRTRVLDMYNSVPDDTSNYVSMYQSVLADYNSKFNNLVQTNINTYLASMQALFTNLTETQRLEYGKANSDGRGLSNIAAQGTFQDQATRERDRFNFLSYLISNRQKSYENDFKYKQLMLEASRIIYIANKEYYDKSTELLTQHLWWKMDAVARVGNFLGAPGSSVSTPSQMTPTQSVMSGAATGAAIGATTGNPLMVGIGAVAGGVAGGIEANEN